jgi:hypothetical protein
VPEYLAPGVYLEEVDGGVRPIEGVDTGTAAMVGLTERGCGSPRLVTCWDEYVQWFGAYLEDLSGAIRDTPDRYLPYAVRGFFDNGGRRLVVARVIGAAAGTASLRIDAATVSAAGAGEWGNDLSVEIVAPSPVVPGPTPRFTMIVRYVRRPTGDAVREPDVLETFARLSAEPGDPRFAETVVNSTSRLVRIAGVTAPLAPCGPARLAGGSHADPDLAAYRGHDDPARATGLAGLSSVAEVSMLAAPGDQAAGLAAELIAHCETRGDRVAILNGPRDAADVARFEPPADTAYAAVYVPWLRVDAPHVREGYAVVPPCGHVAGIYARVAGERGVHEAPAAELVRGAATSLAIDERTAEALHQRGVNVIRDVGDRDLRVAGARTMSSDTTWQLVNVRRLFIFIEQSVDRGLQWVVFEPNDEPLWQRVRRWIEPFLEALWRAGAMRGATARDAFFVRCDRTTMTQDDIDQGRLVVLIGLAVVAPAEFVIVRIGLATGPAGVGAGAAPSDPLAAFEVVLEVGGMRAGFTEVSGVTSSTAIADYRPGDVPEPHKPIGLRKYPNLTLKRGYTSDTGLFDWYRGVLAGTATRRSGTITLRDEARRPIIVWTFVDGWPHVWHGPSIAGKQDGLSIDALELCVERVVVERCA